MFGLDPTIITFTIYIFGMIGIGVAAYYYTKDLSDYILGGRRLGSFVTAMSAGASDMSGWLLMGLPGAVYLSGLVEGWIAIGLTLGAYLNWLFVAGRLRVYTEFNHNALTLPEYFHHRFGTHHNALKNCFCFNHIGVLHDLLCLRRSGWRKIIPKPLFNRLFHRTLVWRPRHNRLYFYRWLPCSELDGYHSSHADDFRLIAHSGLCGNFYRRC